MLEIKRPPSVTSILSYSGGQVTVSLKFIPLVKPGREAGDVWWNLPSVESQGCHLIPLFFFLVLFLHLLVAFFPLFFFFSSSLHKFFNIFCYGTYTFFVWHLLSC